MVVKILLPLLTEQVFTETQTSGMLEFMILSLFTSGTYISVNKVIQIR